MCMALHYALEEESETLKAMLIVRLQDKDKCCPGIPTAPTFHSIFIRREGQGSAFPSPLRGTQGDRMLNGQSQGSNSRLPLKHTASCVCSVSSCRNCPSPRPGKRKQVGKRSLKV